MAQVAFRHPAAPASPAALQRPQGLRPVDRSGAGDTEGLTTARREVQPPTLRLEPASRWDRLWCWLMQPAPGQALSPASLEAVKSEFLIHLVDLRGEAADSMRQRAKGARSLRELWHLRSAVYTHVAMAHTQSEAERRLASLNRHFPVRAANSTFAPSAFLGSGFSSPDSDSGLAPQPRRIIAAPAGPRAAAERRSPWPRLSRIREHPADTHFDTRWVPTQDGAESDTP